MKKFLAISLVVLMALTTFVACGNNTPEETVVDTVADTTAADVVETVKFGMGVHAYYGTASDADGDTDGKADLTATVAAVLVDAEGKVVKCDIDTMDLSAAYTSVGTAVVADSYATKAELGDSYGMALYGGDNNGDGKVLEWYAQADALEGVIVGKTAEEVKALVAGYYGTDEVQAAGCTIGIPDYVNAVVKAIENAVESGATANDTVKVGTVIAVESKDATADANGSVEFEVSVAATATNGGKVTACDADAIQATVSFDAAGKALTDTTVEILTKGEKGDNYGMAAYGSDLNGDGKVLEWYAQADAFCAACLDKNADGIAALVVNGYQAVEDVQTAGCTMGVADIAAALVKAAK